VRPIGVAALIVLVLSGCGSARQKQPSAAKGALGRTSVSQVKHCLAKIGYSTHLSNIATIPAKNVLPKPTKWLMFLGRRGGGIALFYASHSLALDGARRWDSEEQVRVCALLGLPRQCDQGIPRYERKRVRLNVFLNFNLGTPSKATERKVSACVIAAGSS
jgi:hypothetical protein